MIALSFKTYPIAHKPAETKKVAWWEIWAPKTTGNIKIDLLTGINFFAEVKKTNDLMTSLAGLPKLTFWSYLPEGSNQLQQSFSPVNCWGKPVAIEI